MLKSAVRPSAVLRPLEQGSFGSTGRETAVDDAAASDIAVSTTDGLEAVSNWRVSDSLALDAPSFPFA